MAVTEKPDDIEIRTATAEEAVEIARFHVKIWRETYKDMAPEEAVRVLNEDRRLPGWIETLSSTDDTKSTLLALIGGTIVGLVSYGPPTSEIFGDRGGVCSNRPFNGWERPASTASACPWSPRTRRRGISTNPLEEWSMPNSRIPDRSGNPATSLSYGPPKPEHADGKIVPDQDHPEPLRPPAPMTGKAAMRNQRW